MANRRVKTRTHSAPGIYFSEINESYAATSNGITSLGLVGETLRGAAFQSILTQDWAQYQRYFGGTDTTKFKGSQYPKYELPYIAKSYLEQSKQLQIVRVLGLSGVNAGPAWIITANKHKIASGYTYVAISSISGTPTFNSDNTYLSSTAIPTIPDVTIKDPTYVRVVNGINWESTCDDAPTDVPISYFSAVWDGNTSHLTGVNTFETITDAKTYYGGYSNPYYNGFLLNGLANDPYDADNQGKWISGKNMFDDYAAFIAVYPNATASLPTYVKLTTEHTGDNGTTSKYFETKINPNYFRIVKNYEYVVYSDSETRPDDSEFVTVYNIPEIAYNTDSKYLRLVSNSGTYTYYHKEPSGVYTYYKVVQDYDYYIKEYRYNVQTSEEDTCCGYNNMVLLVLRSRGEHKRTSFVRHPTESDKLNGICDDIYEYDGIEYYAEDITLEPSKSLTLDSSCNPGFSATTGDFTVDSTNHGTFTIKVTTNSGATKRYAISLNSADKNYIMNVIGTDPENGESEIYVEEFYDVALGQLIENGSINSINSEILKYENINIVPDYASVYDIMTIPQQELAKKNIGQRYIYSTTDSKGISVKYSVNNGTSWTESAGINGMIYTVLSETDSTTGKKTYFYGAYADGVTYDYTKIESEPTNVTWISCDNEANGDKQNNFYNLPDSSVVSINSNSEEYIKIGIAGDIDGTEDVTEGDFKQINFLRNAINGNSDGNINEYVGCPYFMKLNLDKENGYTTTDKLQIKVTCDNNDVDFINDIEMYTWNFNDTNPQLSRYSFDINGTFVLSTNLPQKDANGNLITYAFYMNAKKKGTYTFTLSVKDSATVDQTISFVITDPAYYQLQGQTFVDSTNINHPTERITAYNYETQVVNSKFTNCVKCEYDDFYYVNYNSDIYPITIDLNNYKEQYRCSSTPWIVSELKGDAENVELHKLFRFHTISDGTSSTKEIKVSIENIDPDGGTFDVLIRDFNDSDKNKSVLERYGGCTLIPGDDHYISLLIGSTDGVYSNKSTYVTVEVNENDATKVSAPAGFLGYPIRNYKGFGITSGFYKYADYGSTIPDGYTEDDIKTVTSIPVSGITLTDPEFIKIQTEGTTTETSSDDKYEYYQKIDALSTGNPVAPYFEYNTLVDEDSKIKKQYFGVSDLVGIDEDVLSYKGKEAYNDLPSGLTPCFHLDSRIFNGVPSSTDNTITESGISQTVSVDGIKGYTWNTVSKYNTTETGDEPRFGSDIIMRNTIYEDINYRKFTVAFYGGWDGWDYYRTSRSNTNEYRYNEYKGAISSNGYGTMFDIYSDSEKMGYENGTKAITSDYYAFLGGYRQFANSNGTAINLLCTPGIDYVNNSELVNEVISMVENERYDTLYIVTTPDKPYGASDSEYDMYTPDEAVSNLEDSDIDTSYACTYYPWIKYKDTTHNQYIYLPLTKDLVRNIAYTDNITYPWYAAAGWNRGEISGEGPRKKLLTSDADVLYDAGINYVNTFSKTDGTSSHKIWGDKNLQIENSPSNRISKRRLLLRVKKLLDTSCIGLLFDPNDSSCARTFESSIRSVLNTVRTQRGIYDYKLAIDNSDELKDKLEIAASIKIKAQPNTEYITISLSLTPLGTVWN